MTEYVIRTGTVTVASGGTTVTGSGTSFLSLLPGALIWLGTQTQPNVVASIASNTSLTLQFAAPSAVTGGTFTAVNVPGSFQTTQLIAQLYASIGLAVDVTTAEKRLVLASQTGEEMIYFRDATPGSAQNERFRAGLLAGDQNLWRIQRSANGTTWADALTINRTTGAVAAAGLSITASQVSNLSATNTPFTPAGTIAATNTQAAVQELDGDLNVLRDQTRATVGVNNTMFGVNSIPAAATGSNNTAMGRSALQNNTTGGANTAVGRGALLANTTGVFNTAVGLDALLSSTTGGFNVAMGASALQNNSTGESNTAIGVNALQNNTTGNLNTAVGINALLNNISFSNCTGLGLDAQVTGSNQVQLGGSATTTFVFGTVQNRSDLRDKADVRDTHLGLDFIMRLRPVDYRWDMREDYRTPMPVAPAINPGDDGYDAAMAAWCVEVDEWIESSRLANIKRDGTKKRSRLHSGLIAQEVVEAIEAERFDKRGWGAVQDHSISGGDDVLSLGYDQFIAPLIRAIQEQQATIAALEARIAALEA